MWLQANTKAALDRANLLSGVRNDIEQVDQHILRTGIELMALSLLQTVHTNPPRQKPFCQNAAILTTLIA